MTLDSRVLDETALRVFPQDGSLLRTAYLIKIEALLAAHPNRKIMAWQIEIHRAKPNPKGKDKVAGFPIPHQLLAEWVDLRNSGDANVALSTLHLSDTDFGPGCEAKQATIYWNGSANTVLKPGEIVRVHTGRSTSASSMLIEDALGVNHHAYAERGNFVLNNSCGDRLAVWFKHSKTGEWIRDDTAAYAPNPPEAAVLYRVGASLISVGSTAVVSR